MNTNVNEKMIFDQFDYFKDICANFEENVSFWQRKGAKLNPLKPPKSFRYEFNKFPFNPEKRNAKPRKEFFYTFDCETKDGLKGKKLFCWSLAYIENKELKVLQGYEDLNPLLEKLFEWKDNSHYRIIYVHNLGFDVRFIADWLSKQGINGKPIISGSNVICYTIDEYRVKFVDSFQFLLESQEKAEIRYEVDENLRKIDCHKIFNTPFEKWNRFEKRRVFKHNANDVKALHQIMTKFRNTLFNLCGVDCLSKISLASVSLKAFRIMLNIQYNEKNHPYMSENANFSKAIMNPFLYVISYIKDGKIKYTYDLDEKREQFVRDSYYGGRCEVFRTDILEKGLYIDRVSMYPAEMKFQYYPTGIPFWVKSKEALLKIIKTQEKLGFIRARIKPTEKCKTNYPILPVKVETKVMFLNTTIEGTYTVPELNYAIAKGYEVDPIMGLIYSKKQKIFNEFIDTFYPIKQHAEGGAKKVAKILLNSCYGKFGQRFRMTQSKFSYFTNEDKLIDFIEEHNPLKVRKAPDSNVWIVTEVEESLVKRTFMNVSIASYVTAYGRLSLTKFIHELEDSNVDIWYCDTDSVVIKRFVKENGNIIDLKERYTSKNHELGDWDIEQEFDRVKFLAPKAYISIQNNKPKLKLKGVERRKITEICENNETLEEIEKEIRQPIELAERYMTFAQAHRNGTILSTKKVIKHYSYEYQKRQIVENGKTMAWNDETISEFGYFDKYLEWKQHNDEKTLNYLLIWDNNGAFYESTVINQ